MDSVLGWWNKTLTCGAKALFGAGIKSRKQENCRAKVKVLCPQHSVWNKKYMKKNKLIRFLIVIGIVVGLFLGGILFAKTQVEWEEPFYMKAEYQDKFVYKIDKFRDGNVYCYVITGYVTGIMSAAINPSISCVVK